MPRRSRCTSTSPITAQCRRADNVDNVASLQTRNNPNFFRGTVVEKAVANEIGVTKIEPVANGYAGCVAVGIRKVDSRGTAVSVDWMGR